MTSNQIIRIMEHMGYAHVKEKSYRGCQVFYNKDEGIRSFSSWSDCESWMRSHYRFDEAKYRAMREAKEMRKQSSQV